MNSGAPRAERVLTTTTAAGRSLVPDGSDGRHGGLTQTTVQRTKSGLPLLVDLPLIGR